MKWINKLYNPSIYQGNLRKKNYFEGWYYKFVNGDGTQAFALIPGVSVGREDPDHAFIQVLDGTLASSYYYSFDIGDFSADDSVFDIKIGQNRFSEKGIDIDLPVLRGSLKISGMHPLKSSILSPGIMGWYSFVPWMECYHGIVSMHHHLNGQLSYHKKAIPYVNGIGYIEKDWGTSFPSCWIWAHSNHFLDEKISLMTSIAHIPWMGSYFVGFITALLVRDKIVTFATYNRSECKVAIEGDTVMMSFRKKNKLLNLKAIAGKGAELRSPIKGLMTGKVNESLQAILHIQYYENGQLIYSGSGEHAGLEVAGNTEILLSKEFRR